MARGEEGRGGDGVGRLRAGRLERRRERLQDRCLTGHAEHRPASKIIVMVSNAEGFHLKAAEAVRAGRRDSRAGWRNGEGN